MLPRELQGVERAEVRRRQNGPCPGGDGTTIGTVQEFTVFCNSNIEGDVLDILDAFDLTACVDICSSFHPRCEGVSFGGSQCTLRANLRPEEQRLSRRFDSAIGSFPGASSDCATLGGPQQAAGTNFTTMCGFIIAGNDLSQNFAPTFQDCLTQCASTTGCAAVSFDPSQDLGFKNCYLKTAVTDSSAVAADRRTDSAMVVAAAAAPPAAGDSSPAGPGVSTVPVPSPGQTAPVSGGAVFFTPPGGASSGAAAPSPSTTSIPLLTPATSNPAATDLVITPPSSSSLTAGTFPFVFPNPTTTPVSSAESVPEETAPDTGSPSMAWVAAPVVGSVAAIALIAVSFVVLKRRRRSGLGDSKKSSISRPFLPLSGFFTSWLPSSWTSSSSSSQQARNESRGSGRRPPMTGMGNFSEVESSSGRRSAEVRASVRTSVVGFMTGRPMGMERLEDIEEGPPGTGDGLGREGGRGGRMELRNSQNGLGQNKWSQ